MTVTSPTAIHGVCEPAFAPLRAAFEASFAEGLEIGASLGACVRGRPVVDLWAGHADAARTRPWERDTIVRVSSTTKIPLTICMLMLVDRGLITLDAPVASYWPAFAAGGKATVTLRDVLSHQAGVPGLDPPPSPSDWWEWDKICARIAAEPHWFGGERKLAYHMITTGHILGEVMRRVDGRTPGQFFQDEIAGPADIDLQIGIREKPTLARCAAVVRQPPDGPPPFDAMGMRVIMSVPMGDGSWESNHAEFPSGNASTNGRALARLGSILADGGMLDGHRYLSERSVREAMTTQVEGVDYLFGQMRMGLSLSLHSDAFPLPSPTCCYWGGQGGSFCVMDPKTGVSVGYAMNHFINAHFGEDPRFTRYWAAIAEVLAGLEATPLP